GSRACRDRRAACRASGPSASLVGTRGPSRRQPPLEAPPARPRTGRQLGSLHVEASAPHLIRVAGFHRAGSAAPVNDLVPRLLAGGGPVVDPALEWVPHIAASFGSGIPAIASHEGHSSARSS